MRSRRALLAPSKLYVAVIVWVVSPCFRSSGWMSPSARPGGAGRWTAWTIVILRCGEMSGRRPFATFAWSVVAAGQKAWLVGFATMLL
jgi:hypothetical protein